MTASFDPAWERIFQSHEWGRYPSEHVIRFVARAFGRAADRRAVRLLDLGSGPGASTWYMAREGFSVAAIDGSPTAVRRLEQRLASEGLTADARLGDFVSLPWEDGTFDGAIDNVALSCNRFAACKRVVAEVHRVLKTGGQFCSTNLTDRSWGYGTGRREELGGFVDLTEGPMANQGFQLFFSRAQIDELYSQFAQVEVELLTRTVDNMQHEIQLWVVACRK